MIYADSENFPVPVDTNSSKSVVYSFINSIIKKSKCCS